MSHSSRTIHLCAALLALAPGIARGQGDTTRLFAPRDAWIALGFTAATVAADIGLHTTESLVIASVGGFLLKGIVGRPLPRQRNAETEDRWPAHARLVGILTYSAASAAGISRLYNNAHWVSDIIFGAGIGILSGTITVRYERSHRGDWLNRVLLHTTIAPQPHHATLVGLHWTVPTFAP